ncbi:MAG: hypothetical protein DRO88_04735 [Promethearchaeia archaeon]|nr:MAG: hypothetical protein DRO88_04735 [Candidatus Lokiarchaeia archaeon]
MNRNPSSFPSSFQWPFTFEQIRDDFFDEIDCLTSCADHYFNGEFESKFEKLRQIVVERSISKVFFIGNTYSYFASQISRQMFMETARKIPFSLYCVELSEFFDYMLPSESEGALYIFISKSGKSRFLKSCVDHLRLTKVDPDLIWLITNNENTYLSPTIQNIFQLFIPHEFVLGSKSFINTIFVVYLTTRVIIGEKPQSTTLQARFSRFIGDLTEYKQNWISTTDQIVQFLSDFDNLYIIARDPASMAAALLGALHAKSFTRLLTEGIYISHFFHGPFQILERKIHPQNIRIILLIGDHTTNESTIYRLVNLILQRTREILVLSNNPGVSQILRKNERIILVDFNAEIQLLAPIFEFFILQFVFLKIAEKKELLKK